MPPLPADSIHARACKLKCEKILTRPDGKKKIRQFENREKMLRQKLSKEERRTRSHHLIVRGAVFESIVPEAKNMTDEEATALLRLALTSEPAREFLRKRAGETTS